MTHKKLDLIALTYSKLKQENKSLLIGHKVFVMITFGCLSFSWQTCSERIKRWI